MEFDLNDSNNINGIGGGRPTDFGNLSPFKEVTNVIGEIEAYSLPFTKASLEELHKRCIDKSASTNTGELTSYSVSKGNGMTVLVNTYESFRDGSFDILFSYGCIPTNEERKRIDNMNSINRFKQSLSSQQQQAAMMMEATL